MKNVPPEFKKSVGLTNSILKLLVEETENLGEMLVVYDMVMFAIVDGVEKEHSQKKAKKIIKSHIESCNYTFNLLGKKDDTRH